MAKATVKFKQVVQPIEKVTLEINQSEVITLLAILSRVGGDPQYSPRKHADSIYEALRVAVNMDYCTLKQTNEFKSVDSSDNSGRRNGIIFDDYKG